MKKIILLIFFIYANCIFSQNIYKKHTNHNEKKVLIEEGFLDKNNAKIGKWIKYDIRTGYITKEGSYLKGKKNGIWKLYYNKKLTQEKKYHNDTIISEKGFFLDGNLKYIHYYKDTKSDGKWLYYHKPNILGSFTKYKNGKIIVLKDYYKNGDLKFHSKKNKITSYLKGNKVFSEKYLDKGKLSKILTYYFNGRVKKSVEYNSNQRIVKITEYYKDGKLLSVTNNGEYRAYDNKGNLLIEGKVKRHNLKYGKWVSYYTNGQTKIEGFFDNSGMVKELINYDKNGQIISVKNIERKKSIVKSNIFEEDVSTEIEPSEEEEYNADLKMANTKCIPLTMK